MMIRRVPVMIAVAVALLGSLSAHAGNKSKTITTTNASGIYNFTCVGPALDLTLDSFSLPISRSATALTSGAAGRAATSALTVEFAANKAYPTLYSQIIKADHYSSCTLIERVDASANGGALTFTWTFSQVTPTAVTMVWRDPAGAGTAGANLPTAQVKATFTFTEVRFQDGSESKSSGAVDSWTVTQ